MTDGPPVMATFLISGRRTRRDEADPFAIGRGERSPRIACFHERRRFELIECAHEELKPPSGADAFVHDASAREDRQDRGRRIQLPAPPRRWASRENV